MLLLEFHGLICCVKKALVLNQEYLEGQITFQEPGSYQLHQKNGWWLLMKLDIVSVPFMIVLDHAKDAAAAEVNAVAVVDT
jgi:hypothetical protein